MSGIQIPPVEVTLDLQQYFDNLVAYRDALTAQIEAMAASGRVCTHSKSALRQDTIQHNGPHGHAWVLCGECEHWVPIGPSGGGGDS